MMDRLGQRFGQYQLLRLLGDGNFGEVYLGERVSDKMLVAVKVLNTSLTNQRDLTEFINEVRTITLDHPYIVKLLDFGIQDGTPFLIMAYAPNGTVRERYPEGTILPLATIIAYAKQVAEALQYAHEQRIIHRDVKPENMLLGPHDQIWLSDFGIAVTAHNTRSQVLEEKVGTVPYMAPEQLLGNPQLASDQYALGIVVYEWLCGSPPFNGSDLELIAQHLHVAPPSLLQTVPTVSPDIERVVLKALAKDPEQRFRSVKEFVQALEEAAQTYYRAGYAPELSATTSIPLAEGGSMEAHAISNPPFQTSTSGPFFMADRQTQEQREGRGQLMMHRQEQEQGERRRKPIITLSLIIGGVLISIVLFSTIAVKDFPGTFPNRSMATPTAKVSPTAKASPTPAQPYPPPGWQLVLNDPLMDNGNGYNWGIGGDSKGGCKFTNVGILVSAAAQIGHLCTNTLPLFSNFAFEVQMTIVQGDEGGIILRRNGDAGDQYAFYISRGGACRFDIEIKNGFSKSLFFRTCPAFHTGLNETNLIAVVANNNEFDLYVNRQFITTVTDPASSFSSGQIGFFADSRNDSTQVLFNNAKVWQPGGSTNN